MFAPCLFRNPDLMVALANAQKEIVFTRLLIETMPLPPDAELAADRAGYWQFVSRVTGKELRPEGLDELVLAGKISADERDIMVAQQAKMQAMLQEEGSPRLTRGT